MTMKRLVSCIFCNKDVEEGAEVCPHCGRDLTVPEDTNVGMTAVVNPMAETENGFVPENNSSELPEEPAEEEVIRTDEVQEDNVLTDSGDEVQEDEAVPEEKAETNDDDDDPTKGWRDPTPEEAAALLAGGSLEHPDGLDRMEDEPEEIIAKPTKSEEVSLSLSAIVWAAGVVVVAMGFLFVVFG